MDRSAENGKSNLYNYNLHTGTGLLPQEDTSAVLSLLAQQTADSAVQIRRGCIASHPWRSGRETACQTCSYGALCRFEVADPRHYRQLMTKEEAAIRVEEEKRRAGGHALD
jgi:ATP-dependent helicase/DNAse subunit B